MNKKVIALLFTFVLFLCLPMSATAAEVGSVSGALYETDYTELPDGSQGHYYLDVSSKTAGEEEKNAVGQFFDGAKSWVTGDAIKDGISGQFYEFLNLVANLIFEWNKTATNIMINFLNFSFDLEILNSWINQLDGIMSNLSGISGLRFSEGGLFGSFIGLIVVTTGLSVVYQMVFKRATIASLDTAVKTIMVLSLSLLLFTNFAPFLQGVNGITNQLSQLLLTGSSNTITAEHRSPEELREGVSDNLWDMFILRPYLIMQYGNENIDDIGTERVAELLEMPKGESRQEYVERTEILESGNTMMTYDNVPNRFVFTFIYSPINAIVSIPIYLLGLALIVFQVWFVLMAFLAPFVLVVAAFPGQFGVLKKYAVELAYPLICKLIATVAVLFIFTLGFLIYNISGNGNISQYLVVVFMQFVMFCMLFLLRKRISSVFSSGNSIIGLRKDIDSLKGALTDVSKKVVQVGAAAATGGSSAAVTAAVGGTVAMGLSNRGSSDHAGDDDAHVSERDANEIDGTKPLASMYDHIATGVSENLTNESDDQNYNHDEEHEIDGTKPLASMYDHMATGESDVAAMENDHQNEVDGTQPIGSIHDGHGNNAEQDPSGKGKASHLRLAYDANQSPSGDSSPEVETENLSFQDSPKEQQHTTMPLVSMYDYMEEPTNPDYSVESEEAPNKTGSPIESDGTKPFASIYDYSPKTIEDNEDPDLRTDETNYQNNSFDGTKPFASIGDHESHDYQNDRLEENNIDPEGETFDEGDIAYRRGEDQ